MADWGDFLNKNTVDGDFVEEEVWGLDESSPTKKVYSKDSSGSSSAWPIPAVPRKIPRANTQTSHEPEGIQAVAQGSSAPVDIPDWAKIYQTANKERGSKNKGKEAGDENDGGDDDDDGGDMIPPHEWLARKLARSQISSFSVCEGRGRTLKGRDLSRVRNAILTKTGFIE